jgi:hypothetical protein
MSLVTLPPEILLIISFFLCTRDVVLLSHTSRLLYQVCKSVLSRRQDIDSRLKPFVPDPREFRHLMQYTQAAIVGDFATAFFTGAPVPSRLDIALVDSARSVGTRQYAWLTFLSRLPDIRGATVIWSSYCDRSGTRLIAYILGMPSQMKLLLWSRKSVFTDVASRVISHAVGFPRIILFSSRRNG